MARLATTAALGLALTGCKLAVMVGEGGDVISQSGNNDCTGPGYCTIDITSPTFSESFTAVARPGYEFVKWQDGWGFQCADQTSTVCTVSVPGGATGLAVVASYETASVRPVFNNVGIDTDGDGLRDSIDPDDDNDGVLDEDDLAPKDPNITTTCAGAPADVVLTEDVDWAIQGSQTLIPLGQSNIASTRFTATANPEYSGQVSVVSSTGNSSVQRRVWISQCPGGAALPDSQCDKLGSSSTVLRWSQGEPSAIDCNIEPLDRYYINYENQNCTDASCDIYRNLYNNGNS